MKLGTKFNLCLTYLLWNGVSTAEITESSLSNEVERDVRSRITGGTTAGLSDYPWFTLLGSNKCGGSLVTPEFILTAAHCKNKYVMKRPAIVGKRCRWSNNCGKPKESIYVEEAFVHPDYEYSPSSHDFMLLKLYKRSTVTPVEMDDGSLSPSYENGRDNLWTAGFGYVNYDYGAKPNKLKHLELKYVDNDICNKEYEDDDWIVEDNMMCAVNDDRSKQACYGDSGGPLYDKAEDKLVGITSWGDDDCSSKLVVYSRIANEIDWITSTICDNHSNPKPDFCKITEVPSKAPTPTVTSTKSPSSSTKAPSSSTKAPSIVSSTKAPTIPSMSPVPVQSTYFQIVAKSTAVEKFCINAGHMIKLEACDATNAEQLWRLDKAGQLRNYDDDYCLTWQRRDDETNENIEMKPCEDQYHPLSEIFVFDGVQHAILLLKSGIDFKQKGFKALSVHGISSGSLVTLEKHNYGMTQGKCWQQWDIVYPEIIPTISV